jgi:O-antigen/teichoic acid export membrane protein
VSTRLVDSGVGDSGVADSGVGDDTDTYCAAADDVTAHDPTAARGATTLRTDTLADSVMILLALTVVQRGVGFVRSLLFCRWLDPQDLGQWDMAYGFLMMAAPLAVLGLPGSFGRYVEHYRQQGQLKTFLKRTAAIVLLLGMIGALAVALFRSRVSQLVFGSPEFVGLTAILAAGLGAVILHNTLTSLFTALRMYRVVCGMQFFNAVLFTGLGVGLLLGWKLSAASVVVAFCLACLLTSCGTTVWLRRAWRAAPESGAPLRHGALWAKLLPFALWMWVTNWLTGLFDFVARYMLIHYSGLDVAEALVQVGQYHSARIVPLLFVGVAELLAAMITPHLSYDWEAGRREQVSRRLNLFLKLFAFGLVSAGVAIEFVAPVLFSVGFEGKYAGGLSVLPWAMISCIWGALSIVAHNYVLCAEKARLTSLALVAGLSVNVVLNLALLPSLGLLGAVLATAAATGVQLTFSYTLNRVNGMRFDLGTLVASAAPALLALGPWIALGALASVGVTAIVGGRLLTHDEKRQLTELGVAYYDRLKAFVRRGQPAGA